MTVKKILLVAPVGEKGGGEVVTLEIARRLDRRRYAPFVACLKPGPLVEELKALGIPAYGLEAHKTRRLDKVARAILHLAEIIRREQIDLIHGCGGSMLLYCGLAAAKAKCHVVWQMHDPLDGKGSFERAFVAVQRRLRPEWTLFGNPAVSASYLRTYHNIKSHSIILPGVDVDHLRADADARRAYSSLDIPQNVPIIAMFARLQHAKGHKFLIQAAAQILKCYPEARFVICGGSLFGLEPDYPAEIKREIEQHGISSRVLLRGYVSDLEKRDILAAASIIVHPALSEPFGLSVLEGMAVGKPVVVTDCAGPALTVVAGKTGLVVPRGDTEALAQALLRLLKDPAQAQSLGSQGRVHVEQNYTIDAMVHQVEEVYEQVLGKTA